MTPPAPRSMRVGIGQLGEPDEEQLQFITQLGVGDVIVNCVGQASDCPIPGAERWAVEDLVNFRTAFENAGLRLAAIENLPTDFYDDVMLGREGRQEQLENVKATIRNLGAAGISTLGYHWSPSLVWSSSHSARVRGGAKARSYDHADFEDAPNTFPEEYTATQLWDTYTTFLEEVLPVAEEAGVTLCVHADDPPVDELGGVARILNSFDALQRAMSVVESPNHKLEFACGVYSEMGEDVVEMVEYFGDRDEIGYVHFRDVSGTVPVFEETFIDEEAGNFDEFEVARALYDTGFDGVIIPDHVPEMASEDSWGTGRAYTVGYLKGLLKAITGISE